MGKFTVSLSLGAGLSDLLGGIAASAVVLPQAMAFGVALFALLGGTPATGALAGLIGAAVLCFCSGMSGATLGLITAPSGPVLILLAGAVASLQAAGVDGMGLFSGVAAILMVAGIFQIVLGLTGGGQLIKFIPHPVVAGFLTGSGLLMVISQRKIFSIGLAMPTVETAWILVPPLVVVATFLIMTWLPRRFPAVPSTIAGLLGGTLIFHLMVLFHPGAMPEFWVIGNIPGREAISFDFELSRFADLPWGVVLTSALALALLASLDTLFTAVIADVETGVRHRSRRELFAQGVGQMVTGMVGGMGGSGTTGATVVSVTTGGRRWSAVVAAVVILLLILFGGKVGAILPISVLAGIIIHVGWRMLEKDMLAWARTRRTRQDAAIAILVTLVTVAYDLMVAIGVGVAIAITFFIRAQVKAPVIHRRSTARQRHSVRSRSDHERKLLDEEGDRIIIYELRGNLFFGSVDRLFNELEGDLDKPVWLILHLQRVTHVDLTGIVILQQIARRLNDHGGQLIFCNVHQAIGLGHQVRKTWQKLSPGKDGPQVKTFNGADEALEYAENQLLETQEVTLVQAGERLALAQTELCSGLPAQVVENLQNVARVVELEKGEKLFAAGEFGDSLYIVLSGEIDIRLPTTRHHYKRLAKYFPGSFFGEVSLLDPGRRTADAVAVFPAELLVVDRDGIEQLTAEGENETIIRLFEVLGRAQGRYLRWSAEEMNRLEQW